MVIVGTREKSDGGGVLTVIRNRPFSLAVLCVSVVLHGWALTIVFLPAGRGLERYVLEFVLIVLSAGVMEILAYSTQKVITFRFVFFARLALILIALNLLGFRSVIVALFLTIPLVLEIVFFDAGFPRFLLFVCLLSALTVTAAIRVAVSFDVVAVVFFGSYAIGLALVALTAYALDAYRENIVERISRIQNLETTVGNLANANKAFQSYVDNLENESAEKERNRITGELHDTVGYALTNVIVMMKAGKILLADDPSALADVLDRVAKQSEHALTDVRQTLHKMKTIQSLEPRGLNAIYGLTRAFEGATGITVELNRGNYPMSLGQRLDSVIFRVVQEALTNAFRHGKATVISIFFWRSSEEIRVAVRDNGKGGVSGTHEEGIGLIGIRDRLAEFRGTLTTKHMAIGFELEVRIPYRIGGLNGTDQSLDRR